MHFVINYRIFIFKKKLKNVLRITKHGQNLKVIFIKTCKLWLKPRASERSCVQVKHEPCSRRWTISNSYSSPFHCSTTPAAKTVAQESIHRPNSSSRAKMLTRLSWGVWSTACRNSLSASYSTNSCLREPSSPYMSSCGPYRLPPTESCLCFQLKFVWKTGGNCNIPVIKEGMQKHNVSLCSSETMQILNPSKQSQTHESHSNLAAAVKKEREDISVSRGLKPFRTDAQKILRGTFWPINSLLGRICSTWKINISLPPLLIIVCAARVFFRCGWGGPGQRRYCIQSGSLGSRHLSHGQLERSLIRRTEAREDLKPELAHGAPGLLVCSGECPGTESKTESMTNPIWLCLGGRRGSLARSREWQKAGEIILFC